MPLTVGDAIRHSSGPTRLRARWVLPIDRPPIENGQVDIEDGRITFVGKATGQTAHDLGHAALLPGFVNVHAHLEYTVLRGLLEDMAFFPWIRSLTTLKAQLTLDDWVSSATLGAAEMLAAGVTTLVDASDAGAAVSALLTSGMRGFVCREVFGIEKEPDTATILSTLKSKLTAMRSQVTRYGGDDRVQIGISPHAPYTVRAELFRALAEFARAESLLQTIHIAESAAEMDLIQHGKGPFAEMFERRGISWKMPGVTPVAYLDSCGALTPGTLVVHTVHLTDADIHLLKERGVTVAHCPKSNGKLGAGIAPVRALRAAEIPLGLGTDSVVSNNSADMFEEMRMAVFFARAREQDTAALNARDALHMATLGGAQAIGMDKEIGSLTRGKRADLCAVRLGDLHLAPTGDDNPIAALVYGCRASDVAFAMVEGKVVYEGGHHVLIDVPRLRNSVSTARKRLFKEAEKLVGPTR